VFPSQLNFIAARGRALELRADARASAEPPDSGDTPVTRVTLRFASAGDSAGLRLLAKLGSGDPPAAAALVAEVDGRLRAALALDGGPAISDPFHRGADLLDLLRLRALQLR
jgi:hypothetical protein